MSVLVERTMGELNEERKPVYPLFQKGAKPRVTQPSETARPTTEAANTPDASDRAELLDVDPNSGRRKRRKTAENKTEREGGEDQAEVIRPVPKRKQRQRTLQEPSQYAVAPLGNLSGPAPIQSEANSYVGQIILSLEESTGPLPIGSEENSSEKSTLPSGVKKQKLQLYPKSGPDGSTIAFIPSLESLIGPPSIKSEANTSASLTTPGEVRPENKLRLNTETSTIGSPPAKSPPGALEPHGFTTLGVRNEVKPRKILRLNPKTGTIGSPPAKKTPRALALESDGKKARASEKKLKTKMVTIRYGHGKDVGQKIDQIMNSTKPTISLLSKVVPEIQKAPASLAKPSKSLHPLFLGKVASKKETSPQKTTQKGVIDLTRAKELPRPRSMGNLSPTKPAPVPFSGFGVAKLMKFPGAIEPAWPWKDMVHIRGFDPTEASLQSALTPSQARSRKFKYQAIEISLAESILGTLATDLCIERVRKEIRKINPDVYPAVPSCLRVPTKHYEPGHNIQKRVLEELHTRPVFPIFGDQSSTEDEIQIAKKIRRPSYPAALLKLYGSISKSFSAFDFGQCETQSWTQKYAPKAADEVLQAGSEAQILKAWLQRLTVQSVEAGLGAGRPTLSKPEKPSKRKRKSKKFDDFIVSTEDEDDDMDEITESEDCASPGGKQDTLRKTVIRSKDVTALGSKEPKKLTNAILISGPHGCGKTAAVYAVAKELGFEVFEINSSSRRNGKDILERVGDMIHNHQVRRSSDIPSVDPVDDDEQRIDDALANDLKSGRQGTMNSFFKPKQEKKQEMKPKPKAATRTAKPAETQKTLFPKPPTKQQKQSLILLEEVDILYKEDTNFWPTVLSLLSISKRPIIMTCNDESVIPIDSLTVHAILRFAPPPVDLAVDFMLMVAAREGHILRRESLKTLYEGRNLDLRASLTELNFWCQFAVGDVKRGLEWYYPRWSRHEDNDEKENTIRVVSEGTYETGMGWLSQDFLESDIHHLDVEEEMLHETCDGWHADVTDSSKSRDSAKKWAEKLQVFSTGKNDNKAALDMYADFAEAMSSADLCSGGLFAPDNQIALESSLPELSQKAKDDYILAHDILEATPLVSYDNLSKDIYLWMQSRTRNHLQVDQHVKHNLEVPTELSRPSEGDVIRLITAQVTEPEATLTRKDLSRAFDPVADPVWPSNSTAIELCSFDRTTALITEDLAPFVRSIVAYDGRLQQERTKLSNLLSEGGRPGKKLRTTRSAMSALEGGARKTTRRDRWFTGKVNTYHVMQTGMQSWYNAAGVEASKRTEELTTSSAVSPEEAGDETCE